MFIGHFGAGFAAKRFAPATSLGTLFLAAQFIDLLWPTLLLLGIERVRIEPGATVVTPLVFEHYPVSHSLAAVLAWAALLGASYRWLLRGNVAGAIAVGALVVSHWLLDAIVHQPDLPLVPGGSTMIGLNGWSSVGSTLAIEVSLFALGVAAYCRATSSIDAIGRWGLVALVVFLLGVYAANLFGAPPPSVRAIAWVGQLQWLLVLAGFWIDSHRRAHIR
ncbi:MAG TPA: hypothetical protein PK956_03055 [Burkholderiaceae bacterium]|jgi:hypothetical protein|nr:hypothetical protein [Burkholderiaceae bacterium]